MTPEEKKVFDQMFWALKIAAGVMHHDTSAKGKANYSVIRDAIAAAKAVSEPKVKLIPTAQEMGAPMQPQPQACKDCGQISISQQPLIHTCSPQVGKV